MGQRARSLGAAALVLAPACASLGAGCGARSGLSLDELVALSIDDGGHETTRPDDGAPADSVTTGIDTGAVNAPVADGPGDDDGAPTDATGGDVFLDGADATDAVASPYAAPRAIAPLSTATVTSQTPTLKWSLADGTDGAEVNVCRDRACTVIVMSVAASGSSVPLPTPLIQGVYFWRLHGMSGSSVGTTTSPVWEFFVGARSAPHDASWGTTLDVNGDGYADVLVGAPNISGSTESAYLYLGSRSGLSTTWTSVTYPGNSNGYDQDPVASAGDVNGDGYADVVIGAPNVQSGTGAALLYMGGPGGMSTTPVTLSSAKADGSFGWSVSSAGDVNGDGYADVVVGSDTTNNSAGAAFLFYGGPEGPTTEPVELTSPLDAGFLYQYFGRDVTSAGDIDGDGFADLLVGATFGDHAFVMYGSASGISTTPVVLTDPNLPDELGDDGEFGLSVACAGDVNGDGFADVLVGAPANGDAYSAEGDTYLYLGGAGGLSTTPIRLALPAVGTGTAFGSAVAGGGDVNGDGYADILSDTLSGSYLYLGGANGPATYPFDITPPLLENNEGGHGAIAGAGDVDGDGYGEVVVGSLWSNGYIGSAYIYMGTANGPGPPVAVTNPDTANGLFGASVY